MKVLRYFYAHQIDIAAYFCSFVSLDKHPIQPGHPEGVCGGTVFLPFLGMHVYHVLPRDFSGHERIGKIIVFEADLSEPQLIAVIMSLNLLSEVQVIF